MLLACLKLVADDASHMKLVLLYEFSIMYYMRVQQGLEQVYKELYDTYV